LASGIVIYFGNPHAESDKLRHPANSKFMKAAAQVRTTTTSLISKTGPAQPDLHTVLFAA
jgi:hypothetical protein